MGTVRKIEGFNKGADKKMAKLLAKKEKKAKAEAEAQERHRRACAPFWQFHQIKKGQAMELKGECRGLSAREAIESFGHWKVLSIISFKGNVFIAHVRHWTGGHTFKIRITHKPKQK